MILLKKKSTSIPTGVKGSDDPPHGAKAEKEKRNTSPHINWAPLNALTGSLLIEALMIMDSGFSLRWLV